jgi:hypothetical protein
LIGSSVIGSKAFGTRSPHPIRVSPIPYADFVSLDACEHFGVRRNVYRTRRLVSYRVIYADGSIAVIFEAKIVGSKVASQKVDTILSIESPVMNIADTASRDSGNLSFPRIVFKSVSA